MTIFNLINIELIAHLCGLAFVIVPIWLIKRRHEKAVMKSHQEHSQYLQH